MCIAALYASYLPDSDDFDEGIAKRRGGGGESERVVVGEQCPWAAGVRTSRAPAADRGGGARGAQRRIAAIQPQRAGPPRSQITGYCPCRESLDWGIEVNNGGGVRDRLLVGMQVTGDRCGTGMIADRY